MPNNRSRLLIERLSNFDLKYDPAFTDPGVLNRQPFLIPDDLLDYLPDALDMLARVKQYVQYDAVYNPEPNMSYVTYPHFLMDYIEPFECEECPDSVDESLEILLFTLLGLTVGTIAGYGVGRGYQFGAFPDWLTLPAGVGYIEVIAGAVRPQGIFAPPQTIVDFGGVNYGAYIPDLIAWDDPDNVGATWTRKIAYRLNIGRQLRSVSVSGETGVSANWRYLPGQIPVNEPYDQIVEVD